MLRFKNLFTKKKKIKFSFKKEYQKEKEEIKAKSPAVAGKRTPVSGAVTMVDNIYL